MCILRYLPSKVPSLSNTTAVLWYRPAARRSNSEPTSTTPCCFASAPRRSVLGPGIGSARSNSSTDSCWQKYGPLCSSCSSTSGTLRSRLGHACFDHRQVGGGVTVVALLDQGDGKGLREFMRAFLREKTCMLARMGGHGVLRAEWVRSVAGRWPAIPWIPQAVQGCRPAAGTTVRPSTALPAAAW